MPDCRALFFRDPVKNEWQTADEYLSGNVRQKLREAKQAAAADPVYLPNVEALRASQPRIWTLLKSKCVSAQPGSTQKYIQQVHGGNLRAAILSAPEYSSAFLSFTAEWSISGKSSPSYSDVNAYMTYGTERANAYKILEDTLNLRDVRIYDTVTDPDGRNGECSTQRRPHLPSKSRQAIRDVFQEWIWARPGQARRAGAALQ